MPNQNVRLLAAAACGATFAGCVSPTPSETLSDAELTALRSAATTAQAVTNAATAVQGVSGKNNADRAQGAGDGVQFGDCPQVTVAGSNADGLEVALTLDFGDGCSPLASEAYTLAGSAAGTFSQRDSAFRVSFSELTANASALSGSVDLTYDVASEEVELSGDWDLDYTAGGASVQNAGDGTVTYRQDGSVTTIRSYDGTTATGDSTWGMTGSDLSVSYMQHGNFVPFSGSATISGNDIRTFTVTFDENSPATGAATVQVGPATFEVNLFEL